MNVPLLEKEDCADLDPDCVASNFPRCLRDDDCGPDEVCVLDAIVPCDDCYPARWRLDGKGRLFDLNTNPEEMAGNEGASIDLDLAILEPAAGCTNLGAIGSSSCPSDGPPPPMKDENDLDPDVTGFLLPDEALCNVSRHLECVLNKWHDCVSDGSAKQARDRFVCELGAFGVGGEFEDDD